MSEFIALDYFIAQRETGKKLVSGHAFETPGWPDFRACVRFDRREGWEPEKRWIIDHYESGLALRPLDGLKSRADAPAALAAHLAEKGPERVGAAIAPYI